jgi:hypothetical protein
MCGKDFVATNKNQKYCGDQCRNEEMNRRRECIESFKKECPVCNKIFSTHRFNQKYCSPECSKSKPWDSFVDLKFKISPGTKGTITEFLVCVDLMKRGYNVFRAISPNSPFDIIAVNHQATHRIEITSGNMIGEKLIYNKHNKWKDHFDIIAVVILSGNKIIYIPEIPTVLV